MLVRFFFHLLSVRMSAPLGAVLLGLSLALRSHDQFLASHWSPQTNPPPPQKKLISYSPPPQFFFDPSPLQIILDPL